MILRRLFLPLFLVLMLASAAVQASALRLMAPVAGGITICSGVGMVTLQLDPLGRPAGAAHLCPDCTAAMAGGLAPGLIALPAPPLADRRPDAPSNASLPVPNAVPVPAARGPPVLI